MDEKLHEWEELARGAWRSAERRNAINGHAEGFLRKMLQFSKFAVRPDDQSGVVERWRQLGAVEQISREVAVEFDGEDTAISEMRHVLTHGREKLIDLHKETQRHTGPFQLVEPDDEELAWVWAIMEREPP